MIIGTAGHIDHGKTSLVRALTGIDTDRLPEEKARGISIELGFAYKLLPSGETLGFVDVPGHARFIRTMLAGASGIDFALLVVAADDGIMPQTREHLAILELLGVRQGLVAITKADLASNSRLEALTADIRSILAPTVLSQAEVLPVSVVSGFGLDDLLARLTVAATVASIRPTHMRFRLPIDRVFTLAGIGIVVTGTVMSGTVRTDENLCVSPTGLPVRVRSIHAQNKLALLAQAGDRCALNLVGEGITREALHRGEVVLDPFLHAPTSRVDATFRVIGSEGRALSQWSAVRLHHGAVEVGAHLVLLEEGELEPGRSTMVQLVLDEPIAVAASDRFVLRDASGQRTLGGGAFIDLRPPTRRRRTPERGAQRAALSLREHTRAFEALLEIAPHAWELTAFARDRALTEDAVTTIVRAIPMVTLKAGGTQTAVSAPRWQEFVRHVVASVGAFHLAHPDRQGIGSDQLRMTLTPGFSAQGFSGALEHTDLRQQVTREGGFVRLLSHAVRLTDQDEAIWFRIAPLLSGEIRFRPPRVRDLTGSLSIPEIDVRRVLHVAGQVGRVDQVAHDHFFLRATVAEMVTIIAEVAQASPGGRFIAAQVRDRLHNGRKVTIQILEFFDRLGLTRQHGDERRVREDRLRLFHPQCFAPTITPGRDSFPVGRSDFKSE